WVDRLGHDRRPVIPGHEVSGIVEALGFGTTRFAVGDAVYGLTDWYRDGSLAEYVAVEGRNLAPKPASLDHVRAAALPMPGLTAWQALFVHGGLAAGQTALIHGAGGGVGSVAVQLARAVAFGGEPRGRQLEELAGRAEAGALRRLVEEVLDLADGARAFQAKRGGGVRRKVVLRMRDEWAPATETAARDSGMAARRAD